LKRIKARATRWGSRLAELPGLALYGVEQVTESPPVQILTATAGALGYLLANSAMNTELGYSPRR
jgi:hypothetical protein